ncbi:MAG: hypothetical protein ACR5LD_06335 [Symbiopectobacterium sp.]
MVTTYNPHQLQSGDNSDDRWQCASLYLHPAFLSISLVVHFGLIRAVQHAPVLVQQLKLLESPAMSRPMSRCISSDWCCYWQH